MSVFVQMFTCISEDPHDQTSPNFLCVAWPWPWPPGCIEIYRVLLVLWMMSYMLIIGQAKATGRVSTRSEIPWSFTVACTQIGSPSAAPDRDWGWSLMSTIVSCGLTWWWSVLGSYHYVQVGPDGTEEEGWGRSCCREAEQLWWHRWQVSCAVSAGIECTQVCLCAMKKLPILSHVSRRPSRNLPNIP